MLPTVSGIVYEKSAAGPRPVVGAVVESVYTHVAAVTDENGHYRLTYMTGGLGTPDGFDTIRVSKEGFETAVRSLVSNGDLRLDVELLRR